MPAREYYPPFLSIITTVCQSAALTGLFMKSGLVSRLIVTFSSFYHIFFPILFNTCKNKAMLNLNVDFTLQLIEAEGARLLRDRTC